ncbi:MAG: bifunctional ADP-dependent NAD(P)H-hydrate dehydratase/NAD(P)H-hydrate epimerase [Spirochaetota bacterium]
MPAYGKDRLFTKQESKALDTYAIEEYRLSSTLLMGVAAMSIYKEYETELLTSDLLVLCGSGNNGGDALALAHFVMQNEAFLQSCHVFVKAGKHTEEFLFYKELLQRTNAEIYDLDSFFMYHEKLASFSGIVIDGLLGIGFRPPLSSLYEKVIEACNRLRANSQYCNILSLDVASGYSLAGTAPYIHVDYLAEIGIRKMQNAFLKSQVKKHSFHSIGFPIASYLQDKHQDRNVFALQPLERKMIATYSERGRISHKFSNGSLVFLGGSQGMQGAIFSAQKAFHHLGGGISKLFSPSASTIQSMLSQDESMMGEVLQDSFFADPFVKKSAVLLLGPGLRPEEFSLPSSGFTRLSGKKIIVDSGALDTFKQLELNDNFILTPHPGEFKRLIDADHSNIEELLTQLQEYVKICKVNLIYRSNFSILCTSLGEVFIWNYPNEKLAVMGSGDLFLGILSYYLSKKYTLELAFHLTQSLLELSRTSKLMYPTAVEIQKYTFHRLYHG